MADAEVYCKHCNRKIIGKIHGEGDYSGKMRCDPRDTMKEYGYNAEPVGSECSQICKGSGI